MKSTTEGRRRSWRCRAAITRIPGTWKGSQKEEGKIPHQWVTKACLRFPPMHATYAFQVKVRSPNLIVEFIRWKTLPVLLSGETVIFFIDTGSILVRYVAVALNESKKG